MARVTLSLPDELLEVIRRQSPQANLSGILQEALRRLLSCDHDKLACSRCAAPVGRGELVDQALSRFYGDALWELGELVHECGTAEGAARVLKYVAERHAITKAATTPLPRPSRQAREWAKRAEERS